MIDVPVVGVAHGFEAVLGHLIRCLSSRTEVCSETSPALKSTERTTRWFRKIRKTRITLLKQEALMIYHDREESDYILQSSRV